MIRILHPGNWDASDVSQAWTLNTRRHIPEVEAAIETAWITALARPGVNLFDGPMCRLESWHATETRLRLTLSNSSYKAFLGTNMMHPEFADLFGPDVMANPIGVSPALITSDRHLLLGYRNHSVAYYPGRIHPFAGCMDPDDENLFSAVDRELAEELSLGSTDISHVRCTGVAEDIHLRQREFIFSARVLRTLAEIQERLDPVEHHDIFSIAATPDTVAETLRKEPRLTPVASAALLLWGRLEFGQSWFEQLADVYIS